MVDNQAMVQEKPKVALGRNSSVLLDVVRFGAAVTVMVSHLPLFSVPTQWISPSMGDMAVCVFFVLSGFVIRFVTETRESTLQAYLIDRASRIYSVLLPALLFTVVAEGICVLFFPAGYGRVADRTVWTHAVSGLVATVTFTLGLWGYGASPLNNIAMWSLPFEVAYYVLYGWLRYRRVARWWLVPLGLLVVGPSIGVLFVVWMLGAWLFDVYGFLGKARRGIAIAGVLFVGVTGAIAVWRHSILAVLRMTEGAAREQWLTKAVASTGLGLRLFGGATLPWFSRLRPSYFILGAEMFVLLLLGMLVLDEVPEIPLRVEKKVRLVADGTFALYCFHLPMLVLIYSVVGHKGTTLAGTVAAATFTAVAGVGLAKPLDRLKTWMRGWLRVVLG